MAKSKPAPPVASGHKASASKVKDGRVGKADMTKPAETAAKMAKALEKKAKHDSSSDDDSDGSSSSDSKSGSSSHDKKSTSQTKSKSKGKKNKDSSSESSSESSDAGSSSDQSSSSESESNDDKLKKISKKAAPVNAPKLTNGAAAGAAASASEGSASDDEDASDAAEVPPKPTKALVSVTNGKPKRGKSSDDGGSSSSSSDSDSRSGNDKDSGSDSSDSDKDSDSDDSGSDSNNETKTKPTQAPKPADAPPQKRKAEDIDAANKKPKPESQAVKNLFVGNLSFNIDDEWLAREFSEFGEVVGARIVNSRDTGHSRGFGYVDFANSEDAEKALFEMRGKSIDGRAINIDYATPKFNNGDQAANPRVRADSRAQKFGDSKSLPSDTLWVGNIPFSADSDSLQQIFEEQGTVLSVRIPTDPETQAIKGFGYVSFASVDEATAALEALNGVQLSGRSLRLDFAPPRDNNRNAGGFRGGRVPDGNWRGGRGGGSPRGGGDRGGFRGDRGGSRGGRGGFGGRGGRGSFGGAGNFQSPKPAGKKITFDD